MPRVKTGIVRRKRHKKVLKEAKGYRGAIKTNYKKRMKLLRKQWLTQQSIENLKRELCVNCGLLELTLLQD